MSEGTQSRIEHRPGEPKQPKSPKRLTDSGSSLEAIRRDLAALKESANAKRTARESGEFPKVERKTTAEGPKTRELLGGMREKIKGLKNDFDQKNEASLRETRQGMAQLDKRLTEQGIDVSAIDALGEIDQEIDETYNEALTGVHATADQLADLLTMQGEEEIPNVEDIFADLQAPSENIEELSSDSLEEITELPEDAVEVELDIDDFETMTEADFLSAVESFKENPNAIQIVAFDKKWKPDSVVSRIEKQPATEQAPLLESYGIPRIPEFSEMTEKERYDLSFEKYALKDIPKQLREFEDVADFTQGEIEIIESAFGDDSESMLESLKKKLAKNYADQETTFLTQHFLYRELAKQRGGQEALDVIRGSIPDKEFKSLERQLIKIEKEDRETEIKLFAETANTLSDAISIHLDKQLEKETDPEVRKILEKEKEEEQKRRKAEDILQNASITGMKRLGDGVNQSFAVSFENTSIKAVSKPALGERSLGGRAFKPGTLYKREWLAGQVARMFGIKEIPPTIIRNDENFGPGSIQKWEAGIDAKKKPDWKKDANMDSVKRLGFFDYAFDNTDRHHENYLIQSDGNLVGIDNGLGAVDQEDPSTLDQLRSEPLEAVAGEHIPKETQQRVKMYLESPLLRKTMEQAYVASLGEKGGKIAFQTFEKKLYTFADEPNKNNRLPHTILK